MMVEWSQITPARRWTLLGIGFLACQVALYGFVWSPLIDDIDRLKAELQQQEQEVRAVLFKIKALQDEEQQLLRTRHDLVEKIPNLPEEVHPQDFRKDVMDLSKKLDITVSAWRPDSMDAWDHPSSKKFGIAIKIYGGFYQAATFLRGLEALPWVQSISSVNVMRMPRLQGDTTISMDIKFHGLPPVVFDQVKKLLTT